MLGIMEVASESTARRAMAHPYALDPQGDRGQGDTWDRNGLAYNEHLERWTGPFVMAAINTRVVRRSHALLDRPWGADFSYTETMSTGRGFKGIAVGVSTLAGLGGFIALAATRPGRAIIRHTVLRAVGAGPNEHSRENGSFRHILVGETAEGPQWYARVVGHKDPGYGCTAVMLGEAALSLALDGRALPDLAGVLTPATGIGAPLLARLSTSGMTWETACWPEQGAPRF
jgi:short subunit dehydrogenase-like uncharacterized protein